MQRGRDVLEHSSGDTRVGRQVVRDWIGRLGSAAEWFYDPSQDEATPGFLARGRADAIRVRKLSAKEDEEHDCVGVRGYELCTPYDVLCYVESHKEARLISELSQR